MSRVFSFLILGLVPLAANAQLEWRISFKLITDGSGNPPPNAFVNMSNEVRLANQILDTTVRGYQYRATEYVNLTGVSQWYNIQARNDSNKVALQAAARANPGLYALRNNAINVYVVNSSSGVCSFPGTGDDIILVGANAYLTLVLHESGHFFNLIHTHEGEQFQNGDGSGCTNGCSCARLIAGESDGTAETAPDNECYGTLDQVAQGAYGLPYASLTADRQWRVNNTLNNVMSYHVPTAPAFLNVLTSDQLDRMADASNGPRFNVASGMTRFVDRNGISFFQQGSSGLPFVTVQNGVNAATPGDIVLIRPGNYNEPGNYTKRLTFRSTRGWATIGRP